MNTEPAIDAFTAPSLVAESSSEHPALAPKGQAGLSKAQGHFDPANLSGTPKSSESCSLQTPRLCHALLGRHQAGIPFACVG